MAMQTKRLITFFDIHPVTKLQVNDVIITNNASFLDPAHKVYYVTAFDTSDKDETVVESIRKAFEVLPVAYQVVQNGLYHMLLRPLIHVLVKIERVIQEEEINELWLFGGSEEPFLTISNAEGEGVKKLYRSAWLFNAVISQYFAGFPSIKIVWQRKRTWVGLAMLHWCREQLHYYRRALGYIVRDFRRGTELLPAMDSEKKIVVALADLELQYKHLEKTIADIDQYDTLYVLGRKLSLIGQNLACRMPALSVTQILGVMKDIRKAHVAGKQITFELKGHRISLSMQRMLLGARERLFVALYQERAFSGLIRSIGPEKIHCVCTNRTMGADICFIHKVCKKHGLLHVNFQYVAMAEILYPEMDVADRYYLYAKNVYHLYKAHGLQFKYYLPLEKQRKIHQQQARSIVIFTQPDTYTDRYLTAIRSILRCFEQNNSEVEILIKLHYRQDKVEDFVACEQYYRHTKVLTTGNAGEVMSECDCVLSMTSSVLFEAMLNGIPAMVIDFDGRDKERIENSGVCVPEVNFVVHTPEDVLRKVSAYQQFTREYLERFSQYLEMNDAGTMDINELIG